MQYSVSKNCDYAQAHAIILMPIFACEWFLSCPTSNDIGYVFLFGQTFLINDDGEKTVCKYLEHLRRLAVLAEAWNIFLLRSISEKKSIENNTICVKLIFSMRIR